MARSHVKEPALPLHRRRLQWRTVALPREIRRLNLEGSVRERPSRWAGRGGGVVCARRLGDAFIITPRRNEPGELVYFVRSGWH